MHRVNIRSCFRYNQRKHLYDVFCNSRFKLGLCEFIHSSRLQAYSSVQYKGFSLLRPMAAFIIMQTSLLFHHGPIYVHSPVILYGPNSLKYGWWWHWYWKETFYYLSRDAKSGLYMHIRSARYCLMYTWCSDCYLLVFGGGHTGGWRQTITPRLRIKTKPAQTRCLQWEYANCYWSLAQTRRTRYTLYTCVNSASAPRRVAVPNGNFLPLPVNPL